MSATFVVEDGTSKTDSNSYISVADADQYNDNHDQDAVWEGADDQVKEKALRLATAYIDDAYGNRFSGYRTEEDQALAFPRTGLTTNDGYLIDGDVIPQKLKDATVEGAILSANGTSLMPDQTDPGAVKSKMVKVGEIQVDTEYTGGNPPNTYFKKIDKLLNQFFSASGTIERA